MGHLHLFSSLRRIHVYCGICVVCPFQSFWYTFFFHYLLCLFLFWFFNVGWLILDGQFLIDLIGTVYFSRICCFFETTQLSIFMVIWFTFCGFLKE